MDRFALWVAEGFGCGRIGPAPGTVGSLAGLVWFAVQLAIGNLWGIVVANALAIGAAIWCCAQAERILGARDPGTVVLDEIVAMPLCYGAWIGWKAWRGLPSASWSAWWSAEGWLVIAAGFVLFRIFDIWKPWIIRQSQQLPGGWGVVADDLLAAAAVNLCALAAIAALHGTDSR